MASVVLDPRIDVVRDETLRRGAPQTSFEALGDRVEHVRDDREDQVILGREVVADHALADAGAARHLGHRRSVEAELDDRVNRAVHQLIATFPLRECGRSFLAFAPSSTHVLILVRTY